MIYQSAQGGCLVLEMDDGKVNFLSLPMRSALISALVRAQEDPLVEAVILAGRGRCFCAGMNVDDFEAGTALSAPSLHGEILAFLARMSKPVIAAIHGDAHGGGLELALGCHYRVAKADAKLSLPEVLVGMMPGARGTQHLPRAVGLEKAAELILNGQRFAAGQAPLGLIDELIEGALLSGAVAFAARVAQDRPIPRLQDLSIEDTSVDLRSFITPNTPECPGTEAAIAALKASATVPYEAAVEQEFAAFLALKDSPESQAFRAAFMAKLKRDAQARRQNQA